MNKKIERSGSNATWVPEHKTPCSSSRILAKLQK